LTADIAVPKDAVGKPKAERRKTKEEIPVTYVPARNTVFLSLAVGLGEVTGSYDIFIGVNHIDYSGYPDCRPEFIEAFERVANLGTKAGVEALAGRQGDKETGRQGDVGRGFKIHAPLIRMTKAEIIREGLRLGVPYGMTHSCYDPTVEGKACGHCDSCLIRLAGFKEAGARDPVAYV
jgi:7-cyano-7-deazaguanine synthase